MRRLAEAPAATNPSSSDGKPLTAGDGRTLKRLLPYLWTYKWRVLAALLLMVGAKVANVGVPVLLKHVVDALDIRPGNPQALLVVPLGLLLAYGGLRLVTSVFGELRELVFSRPRKAQRARLRCIPLSICMP